MGVQESAEAVVVRVAPRMKGRTEVAESARSVRLIDADASKRAGMPGPLPEGRGGTARAGTAARQTITARESTCVRRADEVATMLMEQVVRRENMLAAYRRVVSNGGAPGIDGMTVDDLWAHCQRHWAQVRDDLLSGRYAPEPVRRVEIPKPDGKGVRMLGIPTVMDRLIQQALQQVLTPIFDPTFSNASHGFRPGRGTHDAVRAAKEHIAQGHRWVVDMDLEKFFDRVNHDVLMARVARQVKDKRVLKVIRAFLNAGIMEGGVVSPRSEGTPQGGPLSPLLSNILLDDLDKELERRGHRFVRYADDCNVYVRSRPAGERVLASLERFLTKKLRLKLNREKSAVARPWERKFLGYTVTVHRQPKLRVSPQSVERLKAKIRTILRAGRGRNLDRVCRELSPLIRGWTAYYRLAEVKACFEELDQWLRRKLRCIKWRQWKKWRTRLNEMRRLGLDPERARASACNGRGPWWNAGASHMNQTFPVAELRKLGLLSLLEQHRRFACNH
jgi:RNA-directed DNA polymerase